MPEPSDAFIERWSRRRVMQAGALGLAAFVTPGVFAEALMQTPRMGEGPFYPDKLPLDTDNDLIKISDSVTPAVGQITHLGGRILDRKGNPVRNALIEIWQCDTNGAYLHSRSANRKDRDSHFQGYGRFLTSKSGEYYFRTIKPVAYPGRTPHIHVKISRNDETLLTTQVFNDNEIERNIRDGLFRRLKTQEQRGALLANFKPMKDSKIDELIASWDAVLGWTPEDPEH
jgi:protocatechuate 3,4-dioxygenase beta subunit